MVRRAAGIQKLTGANAYAAWAEGAEVHLSDGRRLLDLGTWAATVLGHRPPVIVAAVGEQLGSLPAAARGLANPCTPLLARRLAELARPSRLEKAWLGANGADVTEAALKLARLATGRMRVLAVAGGFHGRTLGALAVSDADGCRHELAPLLPEVTICEPTPQALERELARGDVAAVIAEVIPGSSAAVPLPEDLLRRWARSTHEAGALLIVDEVQTGLWRCGQFSLSLALGLDPDAVLLGKTLGGGVMPLSAMLCTARMAARLEDNPFLHSQTFSGHPLACAAGLAYLDAAEDATTRDRGRVAAWLAALRPRLGGHAAVVETGARGLMMGVRFTSAHVAGQFVMAAARLGVLVAPSDADRSVVRILAPLVLGEAQMARAADALDRACAGLAPASGTAPPGGPGPVAAAASTAKD
jgi:putrescine aminotransferase